MLNKNSVEIAGNLTRDIEVVTSAAGKSISKFTLAVNDIRNGKDAVYIDCVAFGEVGANIAKVTEKGNNVLVEGRLSVRPYTDKDGNKRKSTEVIVDTFQAITRKPKAAATAATVPAGAAAQDEELL